MDWVHGPGPWGGPWTPSMFCIRPLFQIALSVFPASSDASTHFHIEIPS